ncbi:DUF2380 domain-containing protein [Enterovibrio sp. Hal110]
MLKNKHNEMPFVVKKTVSGIKPFLIMLFIAMLLAWVPIVFASIVVLDFELNDLTLHEDSRHSQYNENAPNATEIARTATLAPLLRKTLQTNHTIDVINVPQVHYLEADQGFGYLYSHPAKAAELGKSVNAEWIAVNRLHKPSFLFAYLITHLVHVPSGHQMPEIIIEIKGQQSNMNDRGINKLAGQINHQIQRSKSDEQ